MRHTHAIAAALLTPLLLGVHHHLPADPPTPAAAAGELGIPFDRFHATDRFGRTITYYLSTNVKPGVSAPLAVWIQGSGGNSLFSKTPDGRTAGGLQNLLLQRLGDRARVLIVEKPGVAYLDNPQPPGSSQGCSDEFKREHTLERFGAALDAALDHVLARADIDRSAILAVGHSEGAVMAAKLAALDPRVTHVACLSGNGPTQLFDLAQIVRTTTQGTPEEREHAVEEVYQTWAEICADPDSATKTAWGHPYRRWSSFLRESPLDNLLATKARVYLAYGTADQAVPVESNDVLRAELTRKQRDLTVDRRVGEDHGYSREGQSFIEGFNTVLSSVVRWWLPQPAASPGPDAPATPAH